MTQLEANQITGLLRAILERNLHNRLTEDLALGMLNNFSAGVQELVGEPKLSRGPDSEPARDTD